ncbi:protein PLASTID TRANSCRIPTIONALLY ACTIVE 14 isoform X3 [Selaginella moellendorffii]|uniref:protein PLASTID TRANSCRIPTIONALLY ACTIVE 14 isoform X2 n=1 Tax=Selaginella moellendorffii TaxID=88036 RepID=UPI000D1C8ED9|nr:protein PLASTID TRANSCRIPTIONALLY ACTIVE 14 isoform X2 [Selaginella moellendorffii]XP_024517521.1 protein PLASTID TRANSCRIPTIONALLY ACTIVE 14 isoform X3 [Selaginella moellendorffii]|eukprot:XP_024517520.1 protein PLASTID TRANSCRIPTIONALLY ACTIVE 14 isoform X2 [Selaginella moellendorffii]
MGYHLVAAAAAAPLVPSLDRFASSKSICGRGLKCGRRRVAAAAAMVAAPPQPQVEEARQGVELMQPEYYTIGHLRHVRAYGVHFKEGPDGVGVYAAKDMTDIERPRVILEVPMEILVTVSSNLPWMFFPDIVPIGHPVFDVINSTDPETDYDIRLGCLLLLALEQDGNFWRLYGDYLPNQAESTDLLLATEEELDALQDSVLSQCIKDEQEKIQKKWEECFHPGAPLKLKRLARDSDRFKWAVGMARSRSHTLTMKIGSKVQVANIISPYADMLNHSFQPTCSLRWRACDRVLEVVVKAGQTIREGDEMTLDYLPKNPTRDYMHRFGFSSPVNPWNVVKFSGSVSIHRDSFLSAFGISGLGPNYYLRGTDDPMADGAVLAAARILPMWSDADLPFLPSMEKRAVRELQKECRQLLSAYPSSYEQDVKLMAAAGEDKSVRWKSALKYRSDEKLFLRKVVRILDVYLSRLLY